MKSEEVKAQILDLISKGDLAAALSHKSVKKMLIFRGVAVADVHTLLNGSLSQKAIVSSLILGLINSPMFE